MSTKIEVILRKKTQGQKWNALEATSTPNKQPTSTPTTTTAGPPTEPIPAPATAAYPTSSRSGAKDWDKIATDLTKKPHRESKGKKKAKDNNDNNKENVPGDGGDESDGAESGDSDYNGGDPVDSFFKKLYAGADPDTRRAMVKSYTESQGTALSTNWAEVEKEKVQARPPSED